MTGLVLWARSLGWALVLSLVQGALIAAGVAVIWQGGKNWRPDVRQRVAQAAQAALVVVLFASAIAFQLSWRTVGDSLPTVIPQLRGANSPALLASSAVSERPQLVELLRQADALAAWLAAAWLIGVLIVGTRLVWHWYVIRGLLRRSRSRGDLQAIVQQVGRRLGVRSTIRLVQAPLASPALLGWWRPTVVVPADLQAALTPAQLEAVIAHEVAHVARGDYAAHMIETMIGALFFFHPAMRYLIGCSRAAREEACDDLAVRVCGNPLVYARALERLESTRHGRVSVPALALTDGHLLTRIRRLIAQRAERRFAASMLPLVMSVSAIAIAFALVLPATVAPAVPIARLRDRLMRIQAEDPAGKFTITMLDGKVLGATLDGETVAPDQLRQRDDQLLFLTRSGAVVFAVNLRLDGISWRARPPAAPPS